MPGLLFITSVLKTEPVTSCISSTCSTTEPQDLEILIHESLLSGAFIHLLKLLVRGEGDA